MHTQYLDVKAAWRLWLMLQHLSNLLWHLYEQEFVRLDEYEQLKRGELMDGFDCTNEEQYPF